MLVECCGRLMLSNKIIQLSVFLNYLYSHLFGHLESLLTTSPSTRALARARILKEIRDKGISYCLMSLDDK